MRRMCAFSRSNCRRCSNAFLVALFLCLCTRKRAKRLAWSSASSDSESSIGLYTQVAGVHRRIYVRSHDNRIPKHYRYGGGIDIYTVYIYRYSQTLVPIAPAHCTIPCLASCLATKEIQTNSSQVFSYRDFTVVKVMRYHAWAWPNGSKYTSS